MKTFIATKTFMDALESDFNTRIDNGGRVYLTEALEKLGFGNYLPGYRKNHAFWDKDGFHENDLDVEIVFDELDVLDVLDVPDVQDILDGKIDFKKKINGIESKKYERN